MNEHMELDFVVVGAQKAASTWLVAKVGAHPQVSIPVHEIPCFEAGYPETPRSVTPMLSSSSDVVRGIKNNNLFFKPESAELLGKYSDQLRILVSLRDPVERLISAYYWHMWVGALPVRPPEEGIAAVLDEVSWDLLEPGFYGKHLARFFDVFGRDAILPLLFEDIKLAPNKALTTVFRFLNVDQNVSLGTLKECPKASVYSLPRLQWNSLRNSSILESGGDEQGRLLWKTSLSSREYLINAFVAGTDRLLLSRVFPNDKPPLSKELIRRIADVYVEDCMYLQQLLERDLSNWKTIKVACH